MQNHYRVLMGTTTYPRGHQEQPYLRKLSCAVWHFSSTPFTPTLSSGFVQSAHAERHVKMSLAFQGQTLRIYSILAVL